MTILVDSKKKTNFIKFFQKIQKSFKNEKKTINTPNPWRKIYMFLCKYETMLDLSTWQLTCWNFKASIVVWELQMLKSACPHAFWSIWSDFWSPNCFKTHAGMHFWAFWVQKCPRHALGLALGCPWAEGKAEGMPSAALGHAFPILENFWFGFQKFHASMEFSGHNQELHKFEQIVTNSNNIVHVHYGFSSLLVILATSGILFFGLSFVCTAGHNI